MKLITLTAAFVIAFAGASYATDGVIEINQARALAGGVTPGDTPGFPVTISQHGSYRLTGDLTVPMGADGIVVTDDNVTIDLNGFAIVGPRDGISGVHRVNLVVTNGSILSVGRLGIVLGSAGRVERVRVTGANGAIHGIDARAPATDVLISGCSVSGFGSIGIYVGHGLVTGNLVSQVYTGIFLSSGQATGNNIAYTSFGLLGSVEGVGYSGNVFSTPPSGTPAGYGTVQLGPNLCGLALCP